MDARALQKYKARLYGILLFITIILGFLIIILKKDIAILFMGLVLFLYISLNLLISLNQKHLIKFFTLLEKTGWKRLLIWSMRWIYLVITAIGSWFFLMMESWQSRRLVFFVLFLLSAWFFPFFHPERPLFTYRENKVGTWYGFLYILPFYRLKRLGFIILALLMLLLNFVLISRNDISPKASVQSIYLENGQRIREPLSLFLKRSMFPTEIDQFKLGLPMVKLAFQMIEDSLIYEDYSTMIQEINFFKEIRNLDIYDNPFLRSYRGMNADRRFKGMENVVYPLQFFQMIHWSSQDIHHAYFFNPLKNQKNDTLNKKKYPLIIFFHGNAGAFQMYLHYFSQLEEFAVLCPSDTSVLHQLKMESTSKFPLNREEAFLLGLFPAC